MRFLRILAAAALLVAPSFSFAETGRIYFNRLTVKDGLPQRSVLDITQDRDGFMWFATRDGVARYDGYSFDVFRNDISDPNSICDNYATSVCADSSDNVWIGTLHGLNRYERISGKIDRFFSDSSCRLSNNRIRDIVVGPGGAVWVSTNNGIDRFDEKTGRFKSFLVSPTGDSKVYCIVAHGQSLLLGTDAGIMSLDPSKGVSRAVFTDPSFGGVHSLLEDARGNVYAGTAEKGVLLFSPNMTLERRFTKENGSINDDAIRSISMDGDGNILIGSFDGLNVYYPDKDSFESYKQAADGANDGLSFFSIHSIYCDRDNTVWLGSYVGGINYYNTNYDDFMSLIKPRIGGEDLIGIVSPMDNDRKGLWIGLEGSGLLYYDYDSGKFSGYSDYAGGELRSNIITAFYDSGGTLLLGTNNGRIMEFDLNTRRFLPKSYRAGTSSVLALYADGEGRIYAGVSGDDGLLVISAEGSIEQKHFPSIISILPNGTGGLLLGSNVGGIYDYSRRSDSASFHSLAVPEIRSDMEVSVNQLFKDSRNCLWACTSNCGLFRLGTDLSVVRRYTMADGLMSNNICSITEDFKGNLWVSTSSSLAMIDINGGSVFNFPCKYVDEFSLRSAISVNDRTMLFFGSDKGVIKISPAAFASQSRIGQPLIKGIKVNGKVIQLLSGKAPSFKHDMSNIGIEYRTIDYIDNKRIVYSYKLKGFDKDWIDADGRTSATYTNLPSGRYVFMVRSGNRYGEWNEVPALFAFNIMPPPWRSWWAIMLYILLALSLSILVAHFVAVRNRLDNDLKVKQMEKENSEKLNNERLDLFTNFSHELRTPLTLIITPLVELLEKNDLPDEVHDTLSMMNANANRLLMLVNQLLDFRKNESGKMKIRVAEGDFAAFSEEIVMAFRELASSRGIALSYHPESKAMYAWYDRSLMEKVLFNLLSNAFNNTDDGGSVDVMLSSSGTFLSMEVADTGCGIPQDKLDLIFNPFYQVTGEGDSKRNAGTGIGLYLTKAIVEMHHGDISVKSIVGQGSAFRFTVPTSRLAFSDEEVVLDYKSSEDISRYISPQNSVPAQGKMKHRYTVLVADDNSELRRYIARALSETYDVIECSNGVDATEYASSRMPDIVVSDIMMPKKDGIQVCHSIKNDPRTSHIPVILLTARSTMIQIEEGLKIGADDYITKPFNMSILLLRIANILASRERMKQHYSKEFNVEGVTEGGDMTSSDERIMQKLYSVIDKNIGNPSLDIELLCGEVGMSKTNLYYKVKSIAGYAPSEFIRHCRMERAAKMLSEGGIPVSEVAIAVGYNDHAYFSNCFKKAFGCSPSEYSKKEKAGGEN